jgi:hypothetical protein
MSMNPRRQPQPSRRRFLQGAAAAASAAVAAPMILRAADLPAAGPGSIQGEGAHKYEWMHDWIVIPEDVKLGNCHGVQQAADGRIFIHHTGTPAMLVTDPSGKVMKTWGPEYAGGAHGLQLRKEGNEEFLYLALTGQHRVVKTNLNGEVVFDIKYPKQAGLYKDKEGKDSDAKYVPTNIAFNPNGDFYVADGYGLSYIHRYNIKGEYISTFGGLGSEPGKMKCCHGIYTDARSGTPLLAVADRENNRIQYFTLEGQHHSFVQGKVDDGIFRRPCHFDVRGTDLLIPDLRGRVTILDKDNKAAAELFDNPDPKKRAVNGVPKDQWADGQFICPHGAIWDSEGNIIVAEWVKPGRITKLRHVA